MKLNYVCYHFWGATSLLSGKEENPKGINETTFASPRRKVRQDLKTLKS